MGATLGSGRFELVPHCDLGHTRPHTTPGGEAGGSFHFPEQPAGVGRGCLFCSPPMTTVGSMWVTLCWNPDQLCPDVCLSWKCHFLIDDHRADG